MSTLFQNVLAAMVAAGLLTACSESEPYSPVSAVETEADVESEEAATFDVEAPPPAAPARSFGAMRAAEAVYRASAAYAVYEPEATDPSAPPIVTAAEFDRLEKGMNYGAAMNIIGAQGKLLEETISGGTGAVIARYRWVNGDGSYADVTFSNQSLTNKTQKRLP